MAAHKTASKPHVVLVAMPLQGHLPATVNLAVKLAAKGFTVTFVNAESEQQSISKLTPSSNGLESDDIFTEARSTGLDIRYELVTDGVPEVFDLSMYQKEIEDLIAVNIPAYVEPLLQRLVSENGEEMSCLITDTFYPWAATMAKKFGIRLVSFWTEPAIVLNIFYHADLLIKNGHFDSEGKERETIRYIPGIPSIEPTELVSYFQEPSVSTPNQQALLKLFEDTKQADFVLGNTVQELEQESIEVLQQQQRFFAIGPITRDNVLSRSTINTSLWPESECSKWLDMQPRASVLYISFGSLFQPGKRDFLEILHGTLGSKARFLWVCPPVEKNSEFDRLLKENEDRGMTVSWCNQKEVLKHPAVGGFLTHCGWNSVLEGIWGEVPMLCFPFFNDQFTNRKLVVKDWKIGLDVGALNEVSRDEVSKRIDIIIGGGEVGVAMRNKVKEVKQVMENALSPNGSSQENFDHFVEELLKRRHPSIDD